MNHKLIVKKIALSTLLLSVAASSAYASESSQTTTSPSQTLTSSTQFQAVAATTAVKRTDPVELAATYAPDTVNDWKNTLTQYHEAIQKKFGAVLIQATPLDSTGTNLNISSVRVIDLTDTKEIADGQFTKVLTQGELTNPTDSTDIKAGVALAVAAIPALPAIPADAETSTFSSTEAKNTVSVAAFSLDNPLSKGEMELQKAAESKDAQVITKSLAKLLVLYKEQIAEWGAKQ
ncbi:hypothetical protein OB236_03535 [Paenibacillus sp. WQ 127069]|uniref:DUF1002 domain-containing protein n=1 Tax=Paenibacillus baimaensis TaxID=2982185 RepID=A0ABT2UAJ0_9BACL|nr:hypothetical protein [Paenibacillus sp. WQ 127069]MCU6791196.1 hypothetical protein [Paenibacillus sp. WQ 127069]